MHPILTKKEHHNSFLYWKLTAYLVTYSICIQFTKLVFLSYNLAYIENELAYECFFFFFCRAYMSVKELKEVLHLSGTDTLNVFFASNSVREELAGAATWPWAKEALTHQGEQRNIKLNYKRQDVTSVFFFLLFFPFFMITFYCCNFEKYFFFPPFPFPVLPFSLSSR